MRLNAKQGIAATVVMITLVVSGCGATNMAVDNPNNDPALAAGNDPALAAQVSPWAFLKDPMLQRQLADVEPPQGLLDALKDGTSLQDFVKATNYQLPAGDSVVEVINGLPGGSAIDPRAGAFFDRASGEYLPVDPSVVADIQKAGEMKWDPTSNSWLDAAGTKSATPPPEMQTAINQFCPNVYWDKTNNSLKLRKDNSEAQVIDYPEVTELAAELPSWKYDGEKNLWRNLGTNEAIAPKSLTVPQDVIQKLQDVQAGKYAYDPNNLEFVVGTDAAKLPVEQVTDAQKLPVERVPVTPSDLAITESVISQTAQGVALQETQVAADDFMSKALGAASFIGGTVAGALIGTLANMAIGALFNSGPSAEQVTLDAINKGFQQMGTELGQISGQIRDLSTQVTSVEQKVVNQTDFDNQNSSAGKLAATVQSIADAQADIAAQMSSGHPKQEILQTDNDQYQAGIADLKLNLLSTDGSAPYARALTGEVGEKGILNAWGTIVLGDEKFLTKAKYQQMQAYAQRWAAISAQGWAQLLGSDQDDAELSKIKAASDAESAAIAPLMPTFNWGDIKQDTDAVVKNGAAETSVIDAQTGNIIVGGAVFDDGNFGITPSLDPKNDQQMPQFGSTHFDNKANSFVVPDNSGTVPGFSAANVVNGFRSNPPTANSGENMLSTGILTDPSALSGWIPSQISLNNYIKQRSSGFVPLHGGTATLLTQSTDKVGGPVFSSSTGTITDMVSAPAYLGAVGDPSGAVSVSECDSTFSVSPQCYFYYKVQQQLNGIDNQTGKAVQYADARNFSLGKHDATGTDAGNIDKNRSTWGTVDKTHGDTVAPQMQVILTADHPAGMDQSFGFGITLPKPGS